MHSFLSLFARVCLSLAALGFLAACQPQFSTATLPPPQVWRVQITPALRWLGPIFNQCTRSLPQITLLSTENALPGLDPAAADFSFSLAPSAGAGYTAMLGQVSLAFIANPANPVSQIAASELFAIFSGELTDWSSLAKADCAGCTQPPAGKVQPYIYPQGDDVAHTFDGLFPNLPLKLADALLAPDPQAVRQAVSADPLAIGYLPAEWVDSTVRSLQVTGLPPEKLKISVLLSAKTEPQDAQRSWVLCVQDNLPK